MIKYEGLKFINYFAIIKFSNNFGKTIEIPISREDGQRIILYLDRLSTVDRELVEHDNTEDT